MHVGSWGLMKGRRRMGCRQQCGERKEDEWEERRMSHGRKKEPSCPTSQLESVRSFLRRRRWCRSYRNHLSGRKQEETWSQQTQSEPIGPKVTTNFQLSCSLFIGDPHLLRTRGFLRVLPGCDLHVLRTLQRCLRRPSDDNHVIQNHQRTWWKNQMHAERHSICQNIINWEETACTSNLLERPLVLLLCWCS